MHVALMFGIGNRNNILFTYPPKPIKEPHMTPKEFANKMQSLIDRLEDDIEGCHAEADYLLCLALKELGYEEGVKLFEEMTKWYA